MTTRPSADDEYTDGESSFTYMIGGYYDLQRAIRNWPGKHRHLESDTQTNRVLRGQWSGITPPSSNSTLILTEDAHRYERARRHPPVRRAVLEFLVAHPGPHTTGSIAGHCRLTVTPTRRQLQNLTAHGVLDLVVGGGPERWEASTWLRERWPSDRGTSA